MSTTYHDLIKPNFQAPKNWIEIQKFGDSYVNKQNLQWDPQTHRGTKYRLIARYEQHYGIFARIARAAFGLPLKILSFIFSSQREWAEDLLFSDRQIHITSRSFRVISDVGCKILIHNELYF